jgi:hypothetical protein
MDYVGKDNLEIMEEMAPTYNQFLAKKFRKIFLRYGYLPSRHILDFGAGIGSLAVELRNLGMENVHCLEIDLGMQQIMQNRGLVVYPVISKLPEKYSFVYMSNVLEHIDDDESLLSSIRNEVMAKSSVLVIYVPAFPLLFSELDEQVGHYRRYTANTLRSVVKTAGLHIEDCRYVDSLGFMALFFLKFALKRNLSLSSNRLLLRVYDKLIFPLSRTLDHLGLDRFFGKNVLLVATKSPDF